MQGSDLRTQPNKMGTQLIEEGGERTYGGQTGPRLFPTTWTNTGPQITHDDELTQRLKTFDTWTSKTQTSKGLATAGFIYTGIADKVECESCGIRLYNWQEDEDPIQAHKKYAPDCNFMLTRFPQVKAPPKPKKTISIKYKQFSDYQSRLDSFKDWPLTCVAQKPEMMAKSGFFYIGSGDRARCFHCGVTLRDWDTDDYPPCAHKQWSQHCPFVQQLDIEELKEEIEDWERMEKAQIEYQHSVFYDCSSSHNHEVEVVTDGVVNVTSSTCSESSRASSDITSSPAIQAVMEMGYTEEVINKALEVIRREGCKDPDAASIMKTIMDTK